MKAISHPVLFIGLALLSLQARAAPSIPVLHSLAIQQNNIVFALTSFGCSRDADFELRVEDGETGITLIRKRPDRCKRAPMVFRVKRSLSASGLSLQTPFSVRNPFAPPPGEQTSTLK